MTHDTTGRRGLATSYAGVTFRSRLEARFAVFFDTLGVRWDYEPEGFELPHGMYVPDFWLPDLKAWFEVKPDLDCVMEERAADLCIDLAAFTGSEVCSAPGLERWPGKTMFAHFTPDTRTIRRVGMAYFTRIGGVIRIARYADGPNPYIVSRDATERARAATFDRPRERAYPLVAPGMPRRAAGQRVNLEDVLR